MNDLDRIMQKFDACRTIRTESDVRYLENAIVELFDVAHAYRLAGAHLDWDGLDDERELTDLEKHIDHAAHRVFLQIRDERQDLT